MKFNPNEMLFSFKKQQNFNPTNMCVSTVWTVWIIIKLFAILFYFILFAGSPWDRNYKQGSVKVVWKPWFCERQTIV